MAHLFFVHGLRVTSNCFDKYRERAEARGHRCTVLPWPYLDRPAAELRDAPPRALGELGLAELVDHFAGRLREMESPPVLVGHSVGGLLVQLLLDRGFGRAAVALDPAPIRGVLPPPGGLAVHAPVLLRPWRRLDLFDRRTFARDFANGLPADEVDAAYDAHVVPAPTRVFLQAGLGRHNGVRPGRDGRPLLLVAGTADRTVPASTVRAAHRKYRRAGAPAELLEAPGHSHWLIAEPGWEKVADQAFDWVDRVASG
jgi:alpha-beta hydrolase superfamily lysophospholipase